jgi:rod shape-determining protein MreC
LFSTFNSQLSTINYQLKTMFDYIRDKPIVALIILIILGIGLGFAQKNAMRHGKTSLVQECVRTLTLPFSMGARGLMVVGEQAKSAARPRSRILKENATLRQRVKNLSLENIQLRAQANENLSLRKELAFKQNTKFNMLSAEVIGRKESAWFDTASINRGRNDNVETASAVVNHNGLIGQVLLTNKFTSEIVSLTNPGSEVGAIVERSRCAGIVQGNGFEYLVMAYLAKDADVKVGDLVVTSGMGKVIPKGFTIGRVVEVNRSTVSMTASAKIMPSVRFDQIEHVFVVSRDSARQ